MKKINKLLSLILIFVLICTAVIACGCNLQEQQPQQQTGEQQGNNQPTIEVGGNTQTTTDPINKDYNVCLCHSMLKQFVDLPLADAKTLMQNYYNGTYNANDSSTFWDKQFANVSFEGNNSYTYKFYVSTDSDFSSGIRTVVSGKTYNAGLLMPNTTYYYKILDERYVVIQQGKIITSDDLLRTLSIDGIGNVRDIGGWKTSSGKTVKYGLLYRGSEFSGTGYNITASGKEQIKALGLKSEIDLRKNSEITTTNVLGISYNHFEIVQYVWSIPENATEKLGGTSCDGNSLAGIKNIFEYLADESHYPCYFHCIWGADRTGTLAFLINGLLGVSYDDLVKDFMLTNCSYSGKFGMRGVGDVDLSVKPNSAGIDAMYWLLMKYYSDGGTLQQAIRNYLTDACHISSETLDSFVGIMLD